MNNYDRMHRGEDKIKIPENKAKVAVDNKRKKVVKSIFAVVLAISFVLLIGLFDIFGTGYSNVLYGAFGVSAIASLIILIVVSILKLVGAKPRKLSFRTLFYMISLCLLIVLFMQIISTVNDYNALTDKTFVNYLDTCYFNGRNNAGGALFGVFAYPFLRYVGAVTSLCVIAVLFFMLILVCFRSFFYVERVQTIIAQESENSGMYIETIDDDKHKHKKDEKIDLSFPNDISPEEEPEEDDDDADIQYSAGSISDRLVSDIFNSGLDREQRVKKAEELLFMSEEELKDKIEKEQIVSEAQNSAIRTGEREPYQTGFSPEQSKNGQKLSPEEAYRNYTSGTISAKDLLFGGVLETPELSYDELYPGNKGRKTDISSLYFNGKEQQTDEVKPVELKDLYASREPSKVDVSPVTPIESIKPATSFRADEPIKPIESVKPVNDVSCEIPPIRPTNNEVVNKGNNRPVESGFVSSTPLPEITSINDAIYDESIDLNDDVEETEEVKPYVEQQMIRHEEDYVMTDTPNPFKTVYNSQYIQSEKENDIDDDYDDYEEEEEDEVIEDIPEVKPKAPVKKPKKEVRPYTCPSLALLGEPEPPVSNIDYVSVYKRIEEAFKSYEMPCRVIAHTRGPTFTLYAVQLGEGVYYKRVISREEDINRKMCCDEPINIVPTVKDMDAIGIEVFYRNLKMSVPLKRYLFAEKFKEPNKLYFPIGVDVYGEPYYCNILGAPHILIGGTTGSGKSVCINAILCTILYNYSPEFVKLILVDPKAVELAPFATIPHNLLGKSIVEAPECIKALQWAIDEMNRRYDIMAAEHFKSLAPYNDYLKGKGEKPLPYIVVIIDELADLMLSNKKTAPELEKRINVLTAKARAAGIHLIIATQRPSTEIITGLIKNNVSTRIAFTMGDVVASKVILDKGGAEKLYGKGDLLYTSSDYSKPLRLQGMYISDSEVNNITDYVKDNNDFEPDEDAYNTIFTQTPFVPDTMISGETVTKPSASEQREKSFNELWNDSLRFATRLGAISISRLQRQFRIGFNKAATIIDKMNELGIIEEEIPGSSKPRQMLITTDDLPDYLEDVANGEN